VKRREFITLLGAAAAWPLAARAQQTDMPLIGSLHSGSERGTGRLMVAFRAGLKEVGYAEGHNVRVEYRWADGAYEHLPSLMRDLVGLRPNVILAFGTTAIREAKKVQSERAAAAIPIVFAAGNDPVADGIVASLSRPGGNITGVTSITGELGSKRLDLLGELLPNVRAISLLVNADNSIAVNERRDAEVAAQALGRQVTVATAKSDRDLERAFEMFVDQNAEAAIVLSDTFFLARMNQIAALANKHKIPTLAPYREFAIGGGLMSYGASIPDVYRQSGIYAGRVLKGTKPSELPILQPTKFDLVINLKTAKALGLAVPSSLLATADEVIE
jgi:putative tryptophan/tyrosine transport system substrate-binding protein